MKVLLVEDEKPLGDAIARLLDGAGYNVSWATDGGMGLKAGLSGEYDLIILDLMLPTKTGWEICAEIRAHRDPTPILMLTARDDLDDRVRGLDMGADDYLAKPFEVPELLARINALVRRDKLNKSFLINIADLEIDRNSRSVLRAGRSISLTRREYDLLEALAVNEGRTLSRETIQDRVWGDEEAISNIVDVFIASLRKKLDAPFDKKLIHTVYGFGYVMRADA